MRRTLAVIATLCAVLDHHGHRVHRRTQAWLRGAPIRSGLPRADPHGVEFVDAPPARRLALRPSLPRSERSPATSSCRTSPLRSRATRWSATLARPSRRPLTGRCVERSWHYDTDRAAARSNSSSAEAARGAQPANQVELYRVEPTAGKPLKTTLNQKVQNAADAALASQRNRSALVAIRISDHAILAVANGPEGGELNLAFTANVPPGSTFKMVSALGLLDSGSVARTTRLWPARERSRSGAARSTMPATSPWARCRFTWTSPSRATRRSARSPAHWAPAVSTRRPGPSVWAQGGSRDGGQHRIRAGQPLGGGGGRGGLRSGTDRGEPRRHGGGHGHGRGWVVAPARPVHDNAGHCRCAECGKGRAARRR